MQLSPDVGAYFAAQIATLDAGEYWNCLTSATTLARLLHGEGCAPWIARVRRSELHEGVTVHLPLSARRLRGRPAWSTHYLCVLNDVALDPAGGKPMPLDGYAQRVFGVDVPLECHVSPQQLIDYLAQHPAAP